MNRNFVKSNAVLTLIIFFAMLITIPASANNWGKKESTEKKVEHLQKKLDLSNDQASQVRTIFEDAKTKMRAVHQEKVDRINALLNPEQKEKFAKECKKWEDNKD